jgi:hypothetical protein
MPWGVKDYGDAVRRLQDEQLQEVPEFVITKRIRELEEQLNGPLAYNVGPGAAAPAPVGLFHDLISRKWTVVGLGVRQSPVTQEEEYYVSLSDAVSREGQYWNNKDFLVSPELYEALDLGDLISISFSIEQGG